MGKNTNTIEINGKRYDAKTGGVLSHKPTMHDVVKRVPAKAAPVHTPKSSQTLMRQSVRKPTAQHSKLRVQGHTDSLATKSATALIESKKSVQSLDQHRLQQAKRINQSRLISHFSAITSDSASQIETVPVTTSEASTEALAVAAQPIAAPTASPSSKPKTTADLLDHALRQARSHEEQPPKHPRGSRRKRRAGLAAAGLVGLLLIGLVGYQQIPNLRLQLASNRAGIGAALPGYRAPGYSLGEVKYSSGVVATQFKSNSDNRAYTLIQKRTDSNSRDLRDNFVATTDQNYQTVEADGRTIYLYGDQNATWIKGGIWYLVQSNGSLSNDQLVQLATSL